MAKQEMFLRQKVIDNTLDAVIIINEKSQIIDWNKQAETIFDYTKQEVLGQTLTQIIIPEYLREAHDKGMKTFLDTKVGPVLDKRIEINALRKNKEIFLIELCITTVEADEGYYFIAFIRDLTDLVILRQHQTLLIKELNHRVKNNLAIIMSIINQSFRYNLDSGQLEKILLQRVTSLTKAHETLFENNYQDVSMLSITNNIMKTFKTDNNTIEIKGVSFIFNPQIAIGYALALNELATNAEKYGALSKKGGAITVEWHIQGNDLLWTWQELGGPEVCQPTKLGFGSRLIKANFAIFNEAEFETEWRSTGLICRLKTKI